MHSNVNPILFYRIQFHPIPSIANRNHANSITSILPIGQLGFRPSIDQAALDHPNETSAQPTSARNQPERNKIFSNDSASNSAPLQTESIDRARAQTQIDYMDSPILSRQLGKPEILALDSSSRKQKAEPARIRRRWIQSVASSAASSSGASSPSSSSSASVSSLTASGHQQAPKLVQWSKEPIRYYEGSTLVLSCSVAISQSAGSTPLKFSWLKQSKPLMASSLSTASHRLSIETLSDYSFLRLADLRASDSGAYTCSVANSLGQEDRTTAQVIVNGK